jgi:hypothetical protein
MNAAKGLLADLRTGDAAWYKGKDDNIYEVRVGTIAKAGPHSMPVWVQIFWTDVEGTMIVMHPQRDLFAHDPRPAPEPEPEPEPVLEPEAPTVVVDLVKRARPRARATATAGA